MDQRSMGNGNFRPPPYRIDWWRDSAIAIFPSIISVAVNTGNSAFCAARDTSTDILQYSGKGRRRQHIVTEGEWEIVAYVIYRMPILTTSRRPSVI